MRQLILLIAGISTACAVSEPVPAPDYSAWFEPGSTISVAEVARSAACASTAGGPIVSYLSDLDELRGWANRRAVRLSATGGGSLPESAYVVIELGQQTSGGHGLAVNRTAGLRSESMVLRATVFEPRQDKWEGSGPSAPCVMVSVPPNAYQSIRVIDQNGHLLAIWADRSS